ncbi:phospholipase A2 (consuming 1,2-dipalmitoylphosphatidylcholine), partial [Desmophyllum pertusum]
MGIKLIVLMSNVLGALVIQNALAESGHEDGCADASKRDLGRFGWMIVYTTRSSPTAFMDYGCYCGPGGNGTAVDDLDRCCKVHDDCYGELQNSERCPENFSVYTSSYTTEWKPTDCKPVSYYGNDEAAECRHRLC